MTRAAWWWPASRKVERLVSAPVIDPATPASVDVVQGDTVNLQIDNVGGDATSWLADNLPPGLSITEENERYCIISGTVQ